MALITTTPKLSLARCGAGSDSGDLTTEQQANTVLAALLQMLLGGEADGEGESEALAGLAKSAEAAAKLEGPRPAEDPYLGPPRLAWGLLLANHAPPNLRGALLNS